MARQGYRAMLVLVLVVGVLWCPQGDGARSGGRRRNKSRAGGKDDRGVLHIAGLFPMTHHNNDLGRGVLPAVQLAMEHINNDSTILPNHRLNMVWNDTQVSNLSPYIMLV